jgi:hypothetical protein
MLFIRYCNPKGIVLFVGKMLLGDGFFWSVEMVERLFVVRIVSEISRKKAKNERRFIYCMKKRGYTILYSGDFSSQGYNVYKLCLEDVKDYLYLHLRFNLGKQEAKPKA